MGQKVRLTRRDGLVETPKVNPEYTHRVDAGLSVCAVFLLFPFPPVFTLPVGRNLKREVYRLTEIPGATIFLRIKIRIQKMLLFLSIFKKCN